MSRYYSDPSREDDKWTLPDLEVFYAEAGELGEAGLDGDGEPNTAGWYWQTCLPGCMPDSDPFGPFESEDEALADARRFAGGFET